MSFSEQTIAIVQKTAPLVAENAVAITSRFYKRMFERNPEVLRYFNKSRQDSGAQPQVLAHAITAFATHIDNVTVLASAVKAMSHRHCALSVTPEMYDIVHDNVMIAIGEILGDAVTPEIGAAWSQAVKGLAEILINEDEALYQKLESRHGGWRGERSFTLTKKTKIGEDTMTFEFSPEIANINSTFEFTAGQYMTIRIPSLDIAPRHFTITSPIGGNTLGCTVRRVPGGVMSNYLFDKMRVGDQVLMGPPCGSFMEQGSEGGAVIITAGIGATPAWALVQQHGMRNIKAAVHFDRSADRDGLRNMFSRAGVDANVYYTGSKHGADESNHQNDRPNLEKVVAATIQKAGKDVIFYICGPKTFMDTVRGALKSNGIEPRSIYTEKFGTGQ